MITQIDAVAFSKMKTDDDILLDVRGLGEFKIANIGGVLIPLDQLDIRFNEIPKGKRVFVLCHHGMRSQMACQFLESQGYTELFNIVGGIDAYARQVDTSIALY